MSRKKGRKTAKYKALLAAHHEVQAAVFAVQRHSGPSFGLASAAALQALGVMISHLQNNYLSGNGKGVAVATAATDCFPPVDSLQTLATQASQWGDPDPLSPSLDKLKTCLEAITAAAS